MANTTVSSGNQKTVFLSEFFAEYIRANRFSRYARPNTNAVIHIKEERTTERKPISMPLITRLTGAGVTGSATLRGNGEALGNYSDLITPTYRRHAVEFDKEEMEKTDIQLMRAAREMLLGWSMENLRDQVIDAMAAADDGTTYGEIDTVAASVRNTWNSNNSDRVLYGATTGNYNATFSTALANIDATDDKLDRGIISTLADIAKTADPHIRPIRVTEDEEFYVCFVGSRSMRHLRSDLETLHSQGLPRTMQGNPLWRAGDLHWENVIIREVPEITAQYTDNASSLFNDAGATSTKVEPVFFCGAQALGWAIGRRTNLIIDRTEDYNFQPGIAVEKKEAVKKLVFNDKQHGMVSGFVSGEV